MIKDLIKLANTLDQMGYRIQADLLDLLIKSAGPGSRFNDQARPLEVLESELAELKKKRLKQRDRRKKFTDERIRELERLITEKQPEQPVSETKKFEKAEPSTVEPDTASLSLEISQQDIEGIEADMNSYSAKVLKEHGLSDEYYVMSTGASDPYSYVYVPSLRGREAFLVTEGPHNTRNYDNAGNAKKEIVIRSTNTAAWNILKKFIPEKYKSKDETESGAQSRVDSETQTGGGEPASEAYHSKWTLGGWTQFRDKDNKVLYYIDNRKIKKKEEFNWPPHGPGGERKEFWPINVGPAYKYIPSYPGQTSGSWRFFASIGQEANDPGWERID